MIERALKGGAARKRLRGTRKARSEPLSGTNGTAGVTSPPSLDQQTEEEVRCWRKGAGTLCFSEQGLAGAASAS